MNEDSYNLQRFVTAQNAVADNNCTFIANALAELRQGRKTSHWMWFIFPQLRGLGSSDLSKKFSISGIREARAYLEHPVLGSRLYECTRLVNSTKHCPIQQIFGEPDDQKFHSCMTLFAHATKENAEFVCAINKYFDGAFDHFTLERLISQQTNIDLRSPSPRPRRH